MLTMRDLAGKAVMAAASAAIVAGALTGCSSSGPSAACRAAVAANNAYVHQILGGRVHGVLLTFWPENLAAGQQRIAQVCPPGTHYLNVQGGL